LRLFGSVNASHRGLLGFMIKKNNVAIKLMITIEESFGVNQKLLMVGFETHYPGSRAFSDSNSRAGSAGTGECQLETTWPGVASEQIGPLRSAAWPIGGT